MPEIYDEVERPARVKIKYLNYKGEETSRTARALRRLHPARKRLHHLNGVLFIDHLSRPRPRRGQAKKAKAA